MLAKTRIEDIMFDKETIIGFLESKDPNEMYDYQYLDQCAFAQFLIEHGTDPMEFYKTQKRQSCLPPGIWDKIVCPGGHSTMYTFGQALARAKILLK